MAITTLDGLVAGLLPSVQFAKATQSFEAAGIWGSSFYTAGSPGAATASADGLAGAALTSYAGQLRFPAAVGGKSVYLAKLEASQTAAIGYIAVLDRLWHNSGFVVTSTGAQTINSVAWPARDRNGSTNGDGVNIAMEVSVATGAGTPTLTVSYTNQAGTAGRTGTIGPVATTLVLGSWYQMNLQAGDTGVRSVQTITSSATMTSGSVSFVAYRHIAGLPMGAASVVVDRDAIALGMPLVYDNTVPFLVHMPSATSATLVDGSLVWAQG